MHSSQPPTTCDAMFFQWQGAELRCNLASHRNDGDKEIANADKFQTTRQCVFVFFGNLFPGHLVPWNVVADLFLFVLDRCIQFVIFDTVFNVLICF